MEINTGIKARIFVFVNSWRSGKDGKLSRFSYSERLSISAPRFQAALIKERSPKWTYILLSNYLILRSFRNIKISDRYWKLSYCDTREQFYQATLQSVWIQVSIAELSSKISQYLDESS